MIATAILLATQSAVAPSMIVSPEQMGAALTICRDQIAALFFDRNTLPRSGWPKVMSQGPDTAGNEMTTFRHPTTMLMITLVSGPEQPSECTVMAPIGPSLTPQLAAKQATVLFGKPKRQQWQTESATVGQSPMSSAGISFKFTKKALQQ